MMKTANEFYEIVLCLKGLFPLQVSVIYKTKPKLTAVTEPVTLNTSEVSLSQSHYAVTHTR